ncbi:Mitochondrial presequence protease [Lobosporangium transversale]|uniref:Presequence protease, mitochondrial n=1 Tax=Lobosporangium transversale TaxID=64571 RepID=A0A1Y2G6G4_9FUNG|nr:peptidase M16C associated-domain-containing protein [Lobosporangium transversale]KAF9906978.1 Mitochondrial presequence protease [Lobosporangium transversale]ORY98294.1 peptidase M16C associated-domain-containing protein [Lobosporangium transversale]|eukprot:XP_021875723.1 peptidase M16C associated-domain-containing protein [Lobosporangium transversale]
MLAAAKVAAIRKITARTPVSSLKSYRAGLATLSTSETWKPGKTLCGYKVLETRHIKELELDAIRLRHEKTGAEHLHISRDDSNNVFGIGFATPPENSTGVPHILEHTTLCGSRSFPVRDPFFKMLNRSMATFMNAFTASDYTLYPFSTTNPIDYKNLRDVYMDAAFFPHLRELDFKQEGWRLEHEDPNDKSSPIVFKGIVYNEMKGQMADSGYLFWSKMQQFMFPGTTYANNSGGDPAYITDLTHEELVRFHKTHYHPSNAKFYSYGNFRLEDTLEAINSKLHEFSPITPPVVDKVVKPFESPRRINLTCPVDPMTPPEKQAKMSVSFLANKATDTFEGFGLRILSDLLTDGHASPMYKALIESDLGSEYSSNTGYDGSTMMSSLSFGVQGMKVENVPKVEQTIIAVLEKVREEGVDPKRVEAIVHQMELGQKHKTSFFGMGLMQGLSSGWFNGCNPLDLLELNKNIDRLKSEISSGPFFQNLINKYLLNNPHKLVFTMVPSTDYGAEVAANEMTRLMGKTSVLTKADKEAIYEQGQALLKNQEKIEDVSCLPTLKVDDISKKTKIFSLEHSAVNSVPVQWRPTSTNGITYFRGISVISELTPDLKKYLPLFADSLTSLGTHKRAMSEIDDEIRLHTGGVRVAPFLSTNHSTIDRTEEGLSFSSYCLDRNQDRMYDLMGALISETNFDNTDKLRTLIKGNASALSNSVADSGHAFARTNAGSRLTPAGYASEIYGGMTQVQFMNSLAQMDDLTEVSQRLKEIANVAIKRSSLRLAVTCGDDQMSSNEKVIGQFISRLDASPVKSFSQLEFSPSYENSFFGLPYGINFTAKCLRGVHYTHEDGAKLQILASLMSNLFLHREIREKNGAYGGGAGYSSTGGLFSFYSYRDPSPKKTLSTYEDSVRWVLDRKDFSDQEMAEAKLSIFQRMDTPVSAAEEGMIIFSEGITDEMRQNRREQLLKVTSDDVKEVANRYLLNQPSSHCILGDEE